PGAHYLVQEGAGAGGSMGLPMPDASGNIAMSATAGKVALLRIATACGATCLSNPSTVDFVGYGTSATEFEGAAPAPGLSNTTAALRANNGATDTDTNSTDFSAGSPNPRNSGAAPPPPTTARIHDIQGASHTSPLVNQAVTSVPGIVTALRTNGFYFQDPEPDTNIATSEGIFVFTSSRPTVTVGDSVLVSGTVQEFRPGGASTNLTTTELASSPTVNVLSHSNPLPPPTTLGQPGRVPPNMVIEDDAASGNVETSGVFDPASDGIDFYESMEGMRVQINNAVVVGPTNSFNEIPVLADNGTGASVRTPRGGILARATDF